MTAPVWTAPSAAPRACVLRALLGARWPPTFVARNELHPDARDHLISWLLAGAVIPCLGLTRLTLMAYTAKREELIACANALFDVVARGIVKSDITRRWPLRDAQEAHRSMEARQTVTRVCSSPEDGHALPRPAQRHQRRRQQRAAGACAGPGLHSTKLSSIAVGSLHCITAALQRVTDPRRHTACGVRSPLDRAGVRCSSLLSSEREGKMKQVPSKQASCNKRACMMRPARAALFVAPHCCSS